MPVRHSYGDARPLAAVALAAVSLVVAAGVASIFLSAVRASSAAIAAQGPASPADGILVVVGLVGVVLSLWVGLGAALTALSALPGALGQACRQLSARVAPAAVRRIVAFVLGTALTAALVPGTAVARTAHQTAPRDATVSSAQYAVGAPANMADVAPDASFRLVSDGAHTRGTVPTSDRVHAHDITRPSKGADSAPRPSWSPERLSPSGESAGGRADVVVQRGDSLWSIAARHLGRAATTAEIDAEWHRWFAANRHVIGDDADAITPGQVLSQPPSARREPASRGASSAQHTSSAQGEPSAQGAS